MRPRLPPLNALKVFEAAARHMSFRRAAEELNVTHSAVSHQVKALEEQFGVPLFERASRRVSLTEAGEVYYPILRDAFDALRGAPNWCARSNRPTCSRSRSMSPWRCAG